VIQRVADDMEGLRVRYTKSKLSAPEVLSTHSRPTYAASVFSGLSDTEFAFDEQIVGTTAYRRALAKPTTASPSQPTSPMAPRPYTPIPISTPLKKAPHAIRVKALFGDSQKLFKDLMKAIKKDDFKKVRELIDLAAPLNVFSTESKFTPLTYAIYHKRNPAIISLLLDARAGPRLLDGDERSPVSCAVDMGDMSIVRSLIRHGVSVVHEEISNGQSLWEKSVKENHPELIEMLVREFGADVHRKEKYGVTALQIATADENQATVEMLLRLGAEY
jgi:ankyrin repeat protein